jgi:Tpt phosphate/phosphoenolpyruvate translocator
LKVIVSPKIENVRQSVVVHSGTASSSGEKGMLEKACESAFGPKFGPTIVTLAFIAFWYALNIGFNLQNKSIYKFFPFPWTVSAVHVIVGTIYCWIMYVIGLKKASFGRKINKEEFNAIVFPAVMHGLGHIAANISFAAVAISLSHTVKTLEPAFSVVLQSIFLGQATPLPVLLSLVPIIGGVALASAAELSFNWTGFIFAMLSNLTFGFRAVLSKKAMNNISNLDSTAIYAYTTLISCFVCVPLALILEGQALMAGVQSAIAKVGASQFYGSLLSVGLLYHLYNQFAFNTLGRVNPVSHGVCNVVKRVVIIYSSVLFFGNVLTPTTQMGTAIALTGTALYTYLSGKAKGKTAGAH